MDKGVLIKPDGRRLIPCARTPVPDSLTAPSPSVLPEETVKELQAIEVDADA